MLYQLAKHRPNLHPSAWVADNAAVIGQVHLAENSSVWFGCTLRGDTDELFIGQGSNIQDGSVLHTDHGVKLRIGDNVTVGHQVMLHGCTIGDNTLVGIQAVILNRAVIGKNSIVGAGSLVPEGKVFPDGVLLLGSPAKVVRELNPAEIALITASAKHYQANAAHYRTALQPL
jgi:carbonic anhydrase/acetyltransferase-like protein (isoleucine patch superfamily)